MHWNFLLNLRKKACGGANIKYYDIGAAVLKEFGLSSLAAPRQGFGRQGKHIPIKAASQ